MTRQSWHFQRMPISAIITDGRATVKICAAINQIVVNSAAIAGVELSLLRASCMPASSIKNSYLTGSGCCSIGITHLSVLPVMVCFAAQQRCSADSNYDNPPLPRSPAAAAAAVARDGRATRGRRRSDMLDQLVPPASVWPS